MKDIITYRKPSAKARAANKSTGAVRITSTAYKGFSITKCLAGGYRVEFNGKVIQPVNTVKAGKVAVDRLARFVA